jgi:hypothetical protein
MVQQEGPDGLYYRDDFNDFSWTCKAGTSDDNGIWMNTSDQAGTVMACLVWVLLGTFLNLNDIHIYALLIELVASDTAHHAN